MEMNFTQAKEFVAKACPPGWSLRRDGNVCRVLDKDGSVLGSAFHWDQALKAACKPLLDAAQAKAIAEQERQAAEAALFLEFLREYLKPAFLEWKAKREAGIGVVPAPVIVAP